MMYYLLIGFVVSLAHVIDEYETISVKELALSLTVLPMIWLPLFILAILLTLNKD